jgi:hypothetical protein
LYLCVHTEGFLRQCFAVGPGCLEPNSGTPPIIDEMINLRLLVEKSADADLLPELIGFAAEKLLVLEISA